MKYSNVLEMNIYDPRLEGEFLVAGSCVPNLYPEIIKKFEKEWGKVFSFCLEEFHYNQLLSKLFNILALGKTKKVGFLTVDGSPHCVQMHFISKYLKRGLNKNVEFRHFVIRKDGKVFEVEMEEIGEVKDLARVGEEIMNINEKGALQFEKFSPKPIEDIKMELKNSGKYNKKFINSVVGGITKSFDR